MTMVVSCSPIAYLCVIPVLKALEQVSINAQWGRWKTQVLHSETVRFTVLMIQSWFYFYKRWSFKIDNEKKVREEGEKSKTADKGS